MSKYIPRLPMGTKTDKTSNSVQTYVNVRIIQDKVNKDNTILGFFKNQRYVSVTQLCKKTLEETIMQNMCRLLVDMSCLIQHRSNAS